MSGSFGSVPATASSALVRPSPSGSAFGSGAQRTPPVGASAETDIGAVPSSSLAMLTPSSVRFSWTRIRSSTFAEPTAPLEVSVGSNAVILRLTPSSGLSGRTTGMVTGGPFSGSGVVLPPAVIVTVGVSSNAAAPVVPSE